MQNRYEPSTRAGYLIAAVIWAVVAASVVAGPPSRLVRLAQQTCERSPSP